MGNYICHVYEKRSPRHLLCRAPLIADVVSEREKKAETAAAAASTVVTTDRQTDRRTDRQRDRLCRSSQQWLARYVCTYVGVLNREIRAHYKSMCGCLRDVT